ncbi:MAG: hypothetical protein ACUVTY_02290 [Armatimonadota bacterium]
MVFYVKSVGTNVTLVDIVGGVKFTVSPAALQKLFGVEMKEGEVWEISAHRREDLEQAFSRWQVIQQA